MHAMSFPSVLPFDGVVHVLMRGGVCMRATNACKCARDGVFLGAPLLPPNSTVSSPFVPSGADAVLSDASVCPHAFGSEGCGPRSIVPSPANVRVRELRLGCLCLLAPCSRVERLATTLFRCCLVHMCPRLLCWVPVLPTRKPELVWLG